MASTTYRDVGEALAAGLVGAAALTLIHEATRRVRSDAPRMDTLGRRALARGLERAGIEPPRAMRCSAGRWPAT